VSRPAVLQPASGSAPSFDETTRRGLFIMQLKFYGRLRQIVTRGCKRGSMKMDYHSSVIMHVVEDGYSCCFTEIEALISAASLDREISLLI
jgi:hypothetical protein